MIGDFLSFSNVNLIQLLIVAIGYLMPIPLAYLAFKLWHDYRQERFISGIKWVLLEIQVPREIVKSPSAMELIFSNALYHKSVKGFWERFIVGAPWLWFSLEIASVDGKVHFYIRTPSRIRDLVETQIYAQYPQAKVVEVEDYTLKIPQYKKDGGFDVWGCEFTKEKEDFLPVKTYKNFGDDLKTGVKEEFKVDPITPTIEYLGSLPKGQQVWIQIIIRQNIKKYRSQKNGKEIDFNTAATEFIDKILEGYIRINDLDKDNIPTAKQYFMPDHLKPLVTAVTDNMSKIHFDCGIRLIAVSDKKYCTLEQFNNLRREVRLLFRQYAMPAQNEFKRINSTLFDAPWSDPTGLALTGLKRRILNFYRLRTLFHPPLQFNFDYPKILSIFFPSGRPYIFVMSPEELATIYHFPGMVSETPSFKRVETKIAKPPSNLPI